MITTLNPCADLGGADAAERGPEPRRGPDCAASATFFSATWPAIYVAEKKIQAEWLAEKKPANLNSDGPKLRPVAVGKLLYPQCSRRDLL